MRLAAALPFGIAMVLCAPGVWASDWIWIAKGGDPDAQVFADSASISDDGPYVLVWLERRYEKPARRSQKGAPVAAIKDRWKFDCSARTGSSVAAVSYTNGGGVISRRGEDGYTVVAVAPDSVLEVGFTFACDLEARGRMVDAYRQRLKSGPAMGQSLSEYLDSHPNGSSKP